MKAIIARNKLGYIGLNGGIPWHSKTDFKHFKSKTLESDNNALPVLLVGYNTSLTLPNLKGRIVVVDNPYYINIDYIDWCIGGKKTYEKYCHLFTELHVSIIEDYTEGDCYFPNLSNLNKDCKIFYYNFNTDKNDT